MSVLDLIKGRFSARKYHPHPVEQEKIDIILEAAQFSQSAKNLQDWCFIVVKDDAMRTKLAEAAKGQRFVAEAPVLIVCCGVGTDYKMTCGQYSYTIDVSIAMENMALTAHELGLGTCWLGAFYEDQVKDFLNIPEDNVRVVGMLTLGYPSTQGPAKRRKDSVEIVMSERWS